jgi:hypothetical protein
MNKVKAELKKVEAKQHAELCNDETYDQRVSKCGSQTSMNMSIAILAEGFVFEFFSHHSEF